MAQVTEDVRVRIDGMLDYLLREWESIEQTARDWDEWTEYDRLDLRLEWPIKESYLLVLGEYAARGELISPQCQQYRDLLKLIERQRPVLDGLLRDDTDD